MQDFDTEVKGIRRCLSFQPILYSMWQIKDPQVKAVTLDFSSSEQGLRQAHQLVADGVELINAIELVEWDSEDTQFLICDACGITHCKPGDWVSLRRTDSLVLILPSSDYVWPEDSNKDEYRPPDYIKKRGIAYLDLATYESLRSRSSSFPQSDYIRPLSLREATLLFHWEAPQRFLGEPPEVRVDRDSVIGASEGDYVDHLKRIETLMHLRYADNAPAQLRPRMENEQVISLYLQDWEFKELKALVFDGSEYRLMVDSTYVIAAR